MLIYLVVQKKRNHAPFGVRTNNKRTLLYTLRRVVVGSATASHEDETHVTTWYPEHTNNTYLYKRPREGETINILFQTHCRSSRVPQCRAQRVRNGIHKYQWQGGEGHALPITLHVTSGRICIPKHYLVDTYEDTRPWDVAASS